LPVFFAVAPRGLEDLLSGELRELGVKDSRNTTGGVAFKSDWETAYRVLMETRIASKLLHTLTTFPAANDEELYRQVLAFPVEKHFGIEDRIAIDAVLRKAPVRHSQFVAQRVKDGIVDRFRRIANGRPSVDLHRPDIRLHLLWQRNEATLSIDLGGRSLHQRGYRKEAGSAPLKENLAAAILYRAGWPDMATKGVDLVDPFCGSGTLVIEAALMAANIAPGLLDSNLGAQAWLHFQPDLWNRIREEAKTRAEDGITNLKSRCMGFDKDSDMVGLARENARRAGLGGKVAFQTRAIGDWEPAMAADLVPGLVVANPPYGERMGELPEAVGIFASFGKVLRECFLGWQAVVLTGDKALGKHLALRAKKVNQVHNGPLLCSLLRFDIDPERFAGAQHAGPSDEKPKSMTPGGQMFANRLQKNKKQLAKWLKREGVTCYRIYDADMPEYNVAVDVYGDHALIQEYQAPKSIDPVQVEKRLHDVLRVVPEVLEIPREKVHLKLRKRQKGTSQYKKLDQQGETLVVEENGLSFEVNLTDYLDTGLFLDHRLVRKRLGEMSQGVSFLNLFAYTGTASVYAARGGARETVTVDMSATYIDWAQRNMRRNGFSDRRHQFIQADCLTWLGEQDRKFDLIFLDPPTFSNSKRMEDTLDVQRDHIALIQSVSCVLAKGGRLIFSNNARRFKLDEEGLANAGFAWEDWSRATLPPDFQRKKLIRQCWLLTPKST